VEMKSFSLASAQATTPIDSTTSGLVSRLLSRYWLRPEPAKTLMFPGKRAGSYPASSSASQAHSRNSRCCGSQSSASRGFMPKKPASNWSACSRKNVART